MNPNSHKHRSMMSILSGLMLYACFYPINLGEIAWVALVPLFLAVLNADSRRQVIVYASAAGLSFYIPAIQWMRVAHPAMYATWIALSLYCTFYLILVMLSIRYFVHRGIPLWLCGPMLFALAEYIRSHFPTGFSFLEPYGMRTLVGFGWYHLGYTQKSNQLLMQLVDATGVYGLSWVIVLANSIIATWLQRYWGVSADSTLPGVNSRSLILATLGSAFVITGAHLYGLGISDVYSRFEKNSRHESLQVALIQTNIPQDLKNARDREMVDQFIKLGDEAARLQTDMIVWPETASPDAWFDSAADAVGGEFPDQWKLYQQNQKQFLLKRFGTNLLIGLNGIVRESTENVWKYNSALFLDRNGNDFNRYDKMHLVPFGEYVPLRRTFPWMKAFTPYDNDYSCRPGENRTRFRLLKAGKDYHFGTLICYEDSDASLAREAIAKAGAAGQPLHFLVNISNDGWFDGTAEHEEHLNICRFRAIETRTPIVRAVNMGISAVIYPDGQFKMIGESIAASKKVAGVLNASIPIFSNEYKPTLYVRYGDWLPALCATSLLVMSISIQFRRSSVR